MDSDFLKGINKAIDAAEGRTGAEHPYKYHTDTTEALDRLAAAISAGGGGASSMSDLEDVDISETPQGGSVLKYDATEGKWTPGDDAGNVQSDWNETSSSSGAYILNKPTLVDNISDLNDVTISSPSADEVLKYDGTTNKWVNSEAPAGASSMGDLTDVTLSTPAGGQSLKYDSTTSKWKNGYISKSLTQAEYNALSPEEKNNGTLYFVNDVDFIRVLTQAEYDALTQAEKLNGMIYVISDGSPSAPSISDLSDILVNTQTLTAGQVLTYDSTSSKWVNAAVPSVQSNWNESDTTAASYIQNKPTIPAEQVRSDWNEANTTAKSYILNKPDLPSGIDDLGAINIDTSTLTNGQTLIYDSTNDEWVNGNNSTGQVQADWNESDTTAASYIQNKPTIPAAQVQSNWNESDSTAVSYIQNKPDPAALLYDYQDNIQGNHEIASSISTTLGAVNYRVTSPGLYLLIGGAYWTGDDTYPISDTGLKSVRITLRNDGAPFVEYNSNFSSVPATNRQIRQQVTWVKEVTAQDIENDVHFCITVRQTSGVTQLVKEHYLQVVKLA